MHREMMDRVRRVTAVALALLLLFSGICMAAPEAGIEKESYDLLSQETEPETGIWQETGKETNRETAKDRNTKQRDVDRQTAKGRDTKQRDEDLQEVLDALFAAAGLNNDRVQDSVSDAQRPEIEKRAEEWSERILGMELLDAWKRLFTITEQTPWLVRVNQATCTVTVYRVLEADKRIPTLEDALEDARKDALGDVSDLISFRKIEEDAQEQSGTRILNLPVYACPCSVGANGGTPNGTFTIQDHLRWHELVGPTWGQWCCHFAPSLLFHSLPYDRPNDPASLQEGVYNLLGTPASHGCVRLAAVDAKYIYDHLPAGTRVEIFSGSEEDDPLGTPDRPCVGTWNKPYDPTDPEYSP